MNGSGFATREEAVAYVAKLNWPSLKLGLRNWTRILFGIDGRTPPPHVPASLWYDMIDTRKHATTTHTMRDVFLSEVRRRRNAGMLGVER